ncbi:MAG: tetratricopeptide repeat protein [Alphaproteobacteria bacterium]|nr:tetratricopeptide repeat protein [Alphaproteobacteria bacterium]MBF0251264.1 tetratricopeptide repeat protein [Alphaproteobacteria bacterium]
MATQAKNKPHKPGGDHGRGGADEARRIYELALEHHRAGRLDAAVKEYARVLRLTPDAADVYNNLGVALRSAGRPEAAVACYRRSLGLRQNAASVYTNLGNALRDIGEIERAVEAHRRAVKHAPKSAKALFNAGLAFRAAGHGKAALEHFTRAVQLEPTFAQCRLEHAVTLLQMGDWTRGFKELEIRFSLPGRDPRRKDIPTWNGSALKGRRILVNYEEDEGTLVQMARFAGVLKRNGAAVVMECPPHLTHLVSNMADVEAVLKPAAAPVNIDVQVPLMSLPARLGTTLENLPEDTPYITAPKSGGLALNIHPRTRLAVGLAWSGSWDGRKTQGPKRSGDMMLDDYSELVGVPGLQLFALERGAGAGDIARLGFQPLIEATGHAIMDVADMAGVIDQLDLVITVDGAAAHIAGALGKPVWMLVGPGASWCWLLDREDSPWYPSMRIFRKAAQDPWTAAVSQVRQALMAVLKGAE